MPFDCAEREVEPVDLACGVVGAGNVQQRERERHGFLSVAGFAVLGSLTAGVLGLGWFLLFVLNDFEGRLEHAL